MEEEQDAARPRIIAVQGYPCTGKTTVAKGLAETLRWPLIHLDNILDVLSPADPVCSDWNSGREDVEALIFKALDVIAPIVRAHMSQEFSVIVDQSFSCRSQLDKFVGIVKDLQPNKPSSSTTVASALIVIECKPNVLFNWEMRFGDWLPKREKWYQPKKWEDVNKLLITRSATPELHPVDGSPMPRVSKLVVDTTASVPPHLLAKAVCDPALGTEGHELVEFTEWMRTHYDGPLVGRGKLGQPLLDRRHTEEDAYTSKRSFCKNGHCVNVFMEDGIDHYAICPVCGKQVLTKSSSSSSSPAYACKFCTLAIHKPCAEGPRVSFSLDEFPRFYERDPEATFCFPEKHCCLRCRLEGKRFSYECGSCIFNSHLRCGLVPTILDHKGHEHRLFFWVRPISMAQEYQCAACALPGKDVAYSCVDRCTDINYHPWCALLPSQVPHQHGGHYHYLELGFASQVQDDYFCSICMEKMYSNAWFYYCPECHFKSHLEKCAFLLD